MADRMAMDDADADDAARASVASGAPCMRMYVHCPAVKLWCTSKYA